MWVKICANTNLDDALQAAEAGADAVGFVFAPSRRQVTPEQVGVICARMPAGVERVGVFMASSAGAIADTVRTAGLTAVQLHGGLDLAFAARLKAELPAGTAIIHTVHWRVDHDLAAAEQVRDALERVATFGGSTVGAGAGSNATMSERLLVDAKVGDASGGLGVAYDWTEAAKVLQRPGARVIVAGGLRPETVADAVRTICPYGVDVASGVEREPGRKDYARVTAFLKNARTAFEG